MYWLYAAYTLLILVFSLMPTSGETILFLDKLVHGLAYTGMAWLGLATFRSHRARWVATGFAVLLGIAVELIQRYIPGRSSSWADELANLIGIGCGLWLGRRWDLAELWDTLRRRLS